MDFPTTQNQSQQMLQIITTKFLQQRINQTQKKYKKVINILGILLISIVIILILIYVNFHLINVKSNLLQQKMAFNRQYQMNKLNDLQSSFIKQFKQYQNKFNDLQSLVKQMDQTIQYLLDLQRIQVYTKRQNALKNPQIDQKLIKYKSKVPFLKKLQKLNHNTPFLGSLYQKQKQQEFKNVTREQYNYYDKKYNISLYAQEQPFCIIIPTWNNARDLRYELNLKSILNQNYTNFHVHIVDDLSDDATYNLIKRYLRRNNISSEKVTLEKATQKMFLLRNTVQPARKYCKANQIVSAIDGDDELLGVNVFRLFNAYYSKYKLGTAYSTNLKYYSVSKTLSKGKSSYYSEDVLKSRTFRKEDYRHSALRTFKGQLLFSIKQQDLKQKGKYIQYGADNVLMYPIQQMSCGKLKFIDQFAYFVNSQTNNNDFQKNRPQQDRVSLLIKSKKVYPCHQNYK